MNWSNFGNVLEFFFWIFVLVSYLIALFSVVGDLFRDRELAGWAKAIWIIFLIFIPVLTTLAYLIARGRGMAERSQSQVRQAKENTEQYIRQVAGRSPSEEIAHAKALQDAGTITAEEYEKLKAKALA